MSAKVDLNTSKVSNTGELHTSGLKESDNAVEGHGDANKEVTDL